MFPEILIGPVLIVCGVFVMVFRRRVVSVMNKKVGKMYGEATADMWASGKRASVGILVAGAGWIALGAITVYAGLSS